MAAHELIAAPTKQKRTSIKEKNYRGSIRDHIRYFNLSISHYRREHESERLYLQTDIKTTLIFNDYSEKNPNRNISCELYTKEIINMNISFAVLVHEECCHCE